jgi:large subunit ribosomal protein L32
MAVPKKKKSKARRNTRRSHGKLTAPNVIDCSQCTEPMLPHRVCPKCGYYKGREVVQVSS